MAKWLKIKQRIDYSKRHFIIHSEINPLLHFSATSFTPKHSLKTSGRRSHAEINSYLTKRSTKTNHDMIKLHKKPNDNSKAYKEKALQLANQIEEVELEIKKLKKCKISRGYYKTEQFAPGKFRESKTNRRKNSLTRFLKPQEPNVKDKLGELEYKAMNRLKYLARVIRELTSVAKAIDPEFNVTDLL